MKIDSVLINGLNLPVFTLGTIVIGSGCAGFNAVDWLYDLGYLDIALVTEGINMGTSRNTGSDKQTYYKLSMASDGADSVYEMAETLFSGGSVNGDTALVEAACSIRSFIKLANLGVPFPTNRYGEYVGYKTDHDPRQRATSAGPLTSKYMTECLQKSVERKNIKIFDNMQIVKLLVQNNEIIGALAIDLDKLDNEVFGFTLFNADNIIMATGGPAGVYYTSVYPESQTGMSGMALEAGANACNLQEWQYGLASTKFRWNVSGTYQQVLPKYIAIDKNGAEREFLLDYFESPQKMLDMVFLKGYQWPFDSAKINGSSIIDIIVHHEVYHKGNRIFMDFRSEPTGLENGFSGLCDETYGYLKNSNALLPSPIARLEKMNSQAIELYKKHGIDLYSEPLEVTVCAQHHNGGIAVDQNWESSIKGLYVVGEAAGTFGTYRPGGSALNSTQVGSMRAAEHIAFNKSRNLRDLEHFVSDISPAVEEFYKDLHSVDENKSSESNIIPNRITFQKAMSSNCAYIRNYEEIKKLYKKTIDSVKDFYNQAQIKSRFEIPFMLQNRDILITQGAILSSVIESINQFGSRGSSLIIDCDGEQLDEQLPEYKYMKKKENYENSVISAQYIGNKYVSLLKPIRPLPKSDDWFENVWNDYLERTKKVVENDE